MRQGSTLPTLWCLRASASGAARVRDRTNKGLIRLRRGEDGDRSSGSTVENDSGDENVCVEHPSVPSADSVEQMEQRLDRGVSRFEMTRPSPHNFAELRVARQDSHILYLEDENLVLNDRLFLVQQEVNELRQRLQQGKKCIDVDESDESDDYQSCLHRSLCA